MMAQNIVTFTVRTKAAVVVLQVLKPMVYLRLISRDRATRIVMRFIKLEVSQ